MTYQGFCAALEKKCEKEGINIKLVDVKSLYKEFERIGDWRCIEKMAREKIFSLKKGA